MQYNYHCNRVVILNLELVQFWLFLAVFGIPLTWSFPIKINPHKTFIYITVNILQYSIIWEIVFPQYFNKKLFLFKVLITMRVNKRKTLAEKHPTAAMDCSVKVASRFLMVTAGFWYCLILQYLVKFEFQIGMCSQRIAGCF
jgi:hypothetical protein